MLPLSKAGQAIRVGFSGSTSTMIGALGTGATVKFVLNGDSQPLALVSNMLYNPEVKPVNTPVVFVKVIDPVIV